MLEESSIYRELDEETLELLAVVVDEPRIWENRSKYKQEGGYNMCKAWKDMKKDARDEVDEKVDMKVDMKANIWVQKQRFAA